MIFSLTPGGAEHLVVDLSNELSKTDEVVVLTLKDDRVDTNNRTFYKSELSDRVTYKNLGFGSGLNLRKMWQIYKAICAEKADIVHLNLRNIPKYCLLAIILLHKKLKFVQTIHNDMASYNELFYRIYFETLGRLKWVHFVTISETNFMDMRKMHPCVDACYILNGRAPVIPSPLYEDVKKEIAAYRTTPDTKIFLHVARCSAQKNQDLLIDAFNELEKRGADMKLLIIGAGFDSERGQRLLAKAGPNIVYLGTRKNVGDYMLNSDVFTLSSLYEGMPITLIEASLAGVPAVSTPVCGAIDMLVDGKNGYLSKNFEVENFANVLAEGAKHSSELRKNAQEMKKSSPFAIDVCADKYRGFFLGKSV